MDQAAPGSPMVPPGPSIRWARLLRQGGMALVCLSAVAVFWGFVDGVYPLQNWLAGRLVGMWGWLALLHLACLSLGTRVTVDWLGLRDRPCAETLVMSMTCGVVGWVLAMYLLGALHLYRGPVFLLLPVVFLAVGLGTLRRLAARYRGDVVDLRAAVAASSSSSSSSSRLLRRATIAFGTLCLGMMYLQLFSPAALNYDSVWCHLTVAEAYAREGGLVPFPADYAKNVPQLTPLFHLWGFVVPGLVPPVRWMFALHNEFALFLWTLVGVVATVGWITGQQQHQARGSWAAFFLFPGIFVYDSNLGGAADHVLAFFALPVLLAAVRLAEQPTRRKAVLLGVVAGGAVLTKYQAVYFLLPVTALLTFRGLLRIGARWWHRRRRAGGGFGDSRPWNELVAIAGIALLTLALVAAPHFLRNFVFYRNPVYPFMQDIFTASRPRVADGAYLVSHIFTDRNWQPQGTLLKKLGDAVVLFFTFSFKPHYYYEFHHNVPSFGSLFTLLLPVLPFLGYQPRLWRVVACASGAVLLWATTFLVDRNLQTFLPLLVAATAGMLILAWDRGWAARLGVGSLVVAQLVWGADALFYSGQERLRSSVDLMSSGFEGRAATRFAAFQAGYVALGRALPPGATVLLRGSHGQLGIDRRVFLDWAGFQGLIDYRSVRGVDDLDALFRSLNITHIARPFGQAAGSTKQEDVLISLYLSQNAQSIGSFGGLEAFVLPTTPLAPRPHRPVIMLGVPGYPDGAYALDGLGVYESLPELSRRRAVPERPLPLDPRQWPALLGGAMATVVGGSAETVPAGFMTAVEQHQTRMRITPGSLQIFAPAAP